MITGGERLAVGKLIERSGACWLMAGGRAAIVEAEGIMPKPCTALFPAAM